MRAERPKPNLPGAFAPMLESNRRQAFAPDAATIPQDGTAAFGRITAQESVLALAPSFRGLVLSFHKSIKVTTA